MREKIFPNDDIIVATHHPKIFEHLNISTYVQGTFPGKDDTPLYLTESLPGPESMTWSVVSNLLCHTVDYCSMALLHRTLPLKDRQIKLRACEEDLKSVEKLVENPEDYVIVHPGRHWNSKTLPLEYWQEIIDRMSEIFKIIIIGKDEKTRGTLNVKCPTNALDLRNLLDLGSLIALISKGKMVVSNDSAPIHIAGAFDNWIALIPTCKHPDHVLPYRNGSPDYKSLTLYKKLPADEFNTQPTCITTSSAEFIFSEWNNYLLTPIEIVEKIKKVLGVNGNHIPIDKNIKVHSFVAEIPV